MLNVELPRCRIDRELCMHAACFGCFCNGSNPTLKEATGEMLPSVTTAFGCFMWIVFSVCLLTNLVLCFTVAQCREMRGGTYMLVVNVAAANLGLAVCCMPLTGIALGSGKWVLGITACQISASLNVFWLVASLFSFAALILHKYFIIVRPLKRSSNKRRFWILVTATWTIAALCVVLFWLDPHQVRYYDDVAMCGPNFAGSNRPWLMMLYVAALYGLPVFLVVLAYLRVVLAVRSHTRRLTFNAITDEASKTATRHFLATLGIMATFYVLGWSPIFVISFLFLTRTIPQLPSPYLIVTVLLVFSTCTLNIVILYARNRKLRKRSYRALKILCCACCTGSYNVAFKEFKSSRRTCRRKASAALSIDRQGSSWYVESDFLQESVDCILSQHEENVEIDSRLAVVRRSMHLESIM